MRRSTELYRHYDPAGVLLYVGVSLYGLARLKDHSNQSAWFERIARVEIERFPSRDAALKAEQDAIAKEKPLYNIRHKQKDLMSAPPDERIEPVAVRRRTAADMLDCSESTVLKLERDGKLKTILVGNDRRITVESLKALATPTAHVATCSVTKRVCQRGCGCGCELENLKRSGRAVMADRSDISPQPSQGRNE